MSELEDKQRIYDLKSELEALKPKAEAYKGIVTDITDIITGYVATSDNPVEAYEVIQAIADIIKDGLNITADDYIRGSLDYALWASISETSMDMSLSIEEWNEIFMSFDDLYELDNEDDSIFMSEVGDISEIQKSN